MDRMNHDLNKIRRKSKLVRQNATNSENHNFSGRAIKGIRVMDTDSKGLETPTVDVPQGPNPRAAVPRRRPSRFTGPTPDLINQIDSRASDIVPVRRLNGQPAGSTQITYEVAVLVFAFRHCDDRCPVLEAFMLIRVDFVSYVGQRPSARPPAGAQNE
jgi:hypothetical protein